jgi:hypothetical protein
VTSWEDTGAYKAGIIDNKGVRIKEKKLSTTEEKSVYNTFHRLVFNLKRIIEKIPGGSAKISSYIAALFLLKEEYNLGPEAIEKIIEASHIDQLDMMTEQTSWFMIRANILSPGLYRLAEDKVVSSNYEQLVYKNDKVRVLEDCQPVGNLLGYDLYEVIHIKTGQNVIVTAGELIK